MDATTRRCLAALSLTTLLAVSACGDQGSTPPDEASDPGTITVTKDAEAEALDRAGLPGSREDKGREAAEAAVSTARILRGLRG